jgi:hypothetical protein
MFVPAGPVVTENVRIVALAWIIGEAYEYPDPDGVRPKSAIPIGAGSDEYDWFGSMTNEPGVSVRWAVRGAGSSTRRWAEALADLGACPPAGTAAFGSGAESAVQPETTTRRTTAARTGRWVVRGRGTGDGRAVG